MKFKKFVKKNGVNLQALVNDANLGDGNVTILFDSKQESLLLHSGSRVAVFEGGANGVVRMPSALNGNWELVGFLAA